jgi:hypothetical protein
VMHITCVTTNIIISIITTHFFIMLIFISMTLLVVYLLSIGIKIVFFVMF